MMAGLHPVAASVARSAIGLIKAVQDKETSSDGLHKLAVEVQQLQTHMQVLGECVAHNQDMVKTLVYIDGTLKKATQLAHRSARLEWAQKMLTKRGMRVIASGKLEQRAAVYRAELLHCISRLTLLASTGEAVTEPVVGLDCIQKSLNSTKRKAQQQVSGCNDADLIHVPWYEGSVEVLELAQPGSSSVLQPDQSSTVTVTQVGHAMPNHAPA